MNETTLNALINLFAIFSSLSESKKEEAVQNFSFYLQLHLGISGPGEYLELFEELLDLYGVDGEPAIPFDMNEQARKICTHIKSRLQKEEQVVVFLRFLEMARGGNLKKAKQLIETIAEVFEIDETERERFMSFIFYRSSKNIKQPGFILIDNNENCRNKNLKHRYEKNLDGELLFLKSPLINHFIFIFNGKEDLTLEGNPIVPSRFYAFKEGSIIRGTRIAPIYYTDIAPFFTDTKTVTPFQFSGDEIEFKFKNSNNGLHRFSFSEQSGQLIAIMGGSGVGKSTLLNILNGNIPVQKGSVKINEHDIYKNPKAIEGLIGYVPQDDLLFEDLTVWENLYYAARLSFDNLTKEAINKKVSSLLNELELLPFKDLKVGNPLKKIISGGQRKRLNVALELIREPSILFVDEPTSGLSSTDSEKVMHLLKQQARKGKLVFVNIHQPSSAIFKLFDKLWILDKGGRPIYAGNPLDAIIYFKQEVNHINADVCECSKCGNVNPEQVLEIVETKQIDSSGNFTSERRFSPEYWYKRFREFQAGRKTATQNENILPKSGFKKPGLLKQFLIFFERNIRTKISDRQYMLINLLEAPVLAAIVAYFTRFAEAEKYIFFENKSLISYLFMSIVVILFMGMSVSAEEIIKDRKILQRESFLNLSRFSYLSAKIRFLVLLSAFQAFSFVLVGNLILGIHHMNLVYWLVLFSTAVFSNFLGLNISSAFDSVVTIYILIPLLLIPQILLCGVIVKFDDLQSKTADKDAVPVVGDLMVSRWAFEALAVEQYKSNRYMIHFFEVEKEMARARFRSDLLTTELIGQVDLVSGWIKLNKGKSEIAQKLNLIKNEIIELDNEEALPPFSYTNKLTPERFTQSVADSTKAHLEKIKAYHGKKYSEKRKTKDRKSRDLGSDYLYTLKLKHHNKSLEALMLNSDLKDYYRETPNGIMQKVAPVYKAPDFKSGRAHFLTSHKNFLGLKIGTLWFNLAVIWLINLLLYLALYYDWLRKIIHISTVIKIKKK
ncbi:MAG: ATP-binding cassette domain-containing protein [Prolixibacteraceae bacterium]|nr:ATP-binding cassette domain-containing protein [Prolixibacteraceae bacterium]